MNEIQLFSLRRTIILSLILGLLSMAIVGQALDTDDSGDGGSVSQQSSSTTTTTTSTTPTSTQQTSNSATQTETVTSAVATATTAEKFDNTQIRDQEFAQDDAATMAAKSGFSDFSGTLSNLFTFSVQYLLTSSLIFAMFAIFYIIIFNNVELKNYINKSLQQAGFQGKISSFGKNWVIKGKGRDFNMRLTGLRNLRMKIELPKENTIDPREFGLRGIENSVITFCDLEVLPMRLQVVRMYLSEIG